MRLFSHGSRIHGLLSTSTTWLAITSLVGASSRLPNPISRVSLIEDAIIHTPSHRVHALSRFDVTFTVSGHRRPIKLTLEPNHDILAEDALITYLDSQGNVQGYEPIDRMQHRVFKGMSWIEEYPGIWSRIGWARIYMKQDGVEPLFEGAFSVLSEQHHIKLRTSYMQTKRSDDVDLPAKREGEYMVLYRDSDLIPPGTQLSDVGSEFGYRRSVAEDNYSCQADVLSSNFNPIFRAMDHSPAISANPRSALFSKRQSDTGSVGGNTGGVNLASTIGDSSGCPSTKKVALIGVAADCSFIASFNSSESARENIISTVNQASDVYERSFNISIGLRNLTLTNSSCPTTPPADTPWNVPCADATITSRLNTFSTWRGGLNDSNAYWTLMTSCPTDSEVGLSWIGQLCVPGWMNDSSSSVASANVVVRVPTEWQVFAHETGHTFGAVHDCDSQTCAQNLENISQCCPLTSITCDANAQYIMNPSTGSPDVTDFSQCTIGNICSALGRNSVKSDCLVDNRGVVTITGSQCGNGIVETGEECDCGGVQGCAGDLCCDPTTCKFINGAVCDDANDNCCSKCQFSPANTVCRASTGPCDLTESCTGTSGQCPADQHLADGTSCSLSNSTISGLACASGQCTSRDLQCQQVMGVLVNSNDTYACDSNSCTILCASSKLPANTCGSLNQNFLDGTPCEGNGYCQNGQCVGSNLGGEISSWIDDHKTLVIIVASTLGGLLVLVILSCIWACFRRRRTPRKGRVGRSRPPPSMTYQPPQSQYGYPPPPSGPPLQYTPRPTWYDGSGGMARTGYA